MDFHTVLVENHTAGRKLSRAKNLLKILATMAWGVQARFDIMYAAWRLADNIKIFSDLVKKIQLFGLKISTVITGSGLL